MKRDSIATGREPDGGHNSSLARAERPMAEALRLHEFYRGKIETGIRCRVRDVDDFSLWYTPGVAAPCRAIEKDPRRAWDLTCKGNTVAVISDGSRVLGLGEIGPLAGMPVMEGKALLFKYLGGVDAVPLMLDTSDPEGFIAAVLALQPSFGGINLEDLAQPKCYRILDELLRQADIPVWHDDQQGTATVILAGLLNALRISGRKLEDVSITFLGCGASNSTAARLIFKRGADPGRCYICDRNGLLGRHRDDLLQADDGFDRKRELCRITNAAGRRGGAAEALRGADVVIAASRPGPGTLDPDWIRGMAPDPIVFACANPVPEIWPWEAREAGAAIVGTGRSDFPNQVNNSLGFPGIFRGTLDVQARTITDEMCFAAADALAGSVGDRIDAERILPTMAELEAFAREAAAVGRCAIEQKLARRDLSYEGLFANAMSAIERSRAMTAADMRDGFIAAPPDREEKT